MKAVTFSTFGGEDVIDITDVPVPESETGQVRVKVRAAAVHPIDIADAAEGPAPDHDARRVLRR